MSKTRTWKFPSSAGGLTLKGFSRAGKATAFYIPELNWNLDAGYAELTKQNPKPEFIFISHGHADHSFMLPYLWSNKEPTKVFAPPELVKFIRQYSTSAAQLNNCLDEVSPTDASQILVVVGAEPGQVYKVTAGKREFSMSCVRCHHTVPSVGFCFSELRKKLKDEFKDLPGKEIGRLIKEGKEVNTMASVNLFAFLGDTTPKVFETAPELFGYPVIIVECTLLVEEHYSASQPGGHTHWRDLRPIVESHPDNVFVLIHFSVRYKRKDIVGFFEPIQETLKNIVVWVEEQDEE